MRFFLSRSFVMFVVLILALAALMIVLMLTVLEDIFPSRTASEWLDDLQNGRSSASLATQDSVESKSTGTSSDEHHGGHGTERKSSSTSAINRLRMGTLMKGIDVMKRTFSRKPDGAPINYSSYGEDDNDDNDDDDGLQDNNARVVSESENKIPGSSSSKESLLSSSSSPTRVGSASSRFAEIDRRLKTKSSTKLARIGVDLEQHWQRDNQLASEVLKLRSEIKELSKLMQKTVMQNEMKSKGNMRPEVDKQEKAGYSAHLSWIYHGCFKDHRTSRDLDRLAPLFAPDIESCHSYCKNAGFRFFGLQNRIECWCGSSFGKHGRVEERLSADDSKHATANNGCLLSCNMSPELTCGGPWANDIYEIKGDLGSGKDRKQEILPDMENLHSSVSCHGEDKERVCDFRNLCWENTRSASKDNSDPWAKSFVFHWDRNSVIESKEAQFLDFPKHRSYPPLLGTAEKIIWPFMDLNTVNSASAMGLSVRNAASLQKRRKPVKFVTGTSLIFSRFLPYNIMHTIHDDLLGIFFTLIKFAPSHFSERQGGSSGSYEKDAESSDSSAPFDLHAQLVIADDHAPAEYIHLLRAFSNRHVMHLSDLGAAAASDEGNEMRSRLNSESTDHFAGSRQTRDDIPMICFERAIVGLEHTGNWYQYGFDSPQGPIPEKFLFNRLKELQASKIPELSKSNPLASIVKPDKVAGWMSHRMQYEPPVFVGYNGSMKDSSYLDMKKTVIFSRSQNRLILNEMDLARQLHLEFNLPVMIIRLEDMPLIDIMQALRSTKVAIGMHGSALILAIFMPRRSLLLELFPFAVPSENYTPYKTMCELPGMEIKYIAWENKRQEDNLPHPNNPRLLGGLQELSDEERQRVMTTNTVPKHICCENPYWLYRIYQDTRVNGEEIVNLIRNSGVIA